MKSSFIKSFLTLLVVLVAVNAYTQDLFKLPGKTPELIAPNFVNTDSVEINFVFNNSQSECFFMRIVKKSFLIFHSQKLKGKWTQPEAINLFSPDSIAHAIDMTVTPDGKIMYFLGVNHQGVIENKPPDIYKSEKIDGIWQPASKVDHPISTDEFIESYPVVVSDGSIFFASNRTGGYGGRDIYRAQYLGEGKFEEPLNLGAPINTSFNEGTTYVAPEESYLIKTASKEDSKQGFYMSRFRNNQWQKLEYIDFGLPFEEGWVYFCPYVLPDGKTLVYSRRYNNPNDKSWNGVEKGEVYWVDISDYILGNE